MLETSLIGTENLLTALDGRLVRRFVHAGSFLEYGLCPVHVEDQEAVPVTHRGVAKLSSTLLCRQRALADRFPAVTLRIFSVYGPWESLHRLVPSAVRAALTGAELPLTAPGIRRDLVFVDDVVEAFIVAMTADGLDGEIVNVGSGEETSNEDIVALVGEVAGRRIAVRTGTYPRRSSDAAHHRADTRKAEKLLRWKSRTSLREGLSRTVTWWRERT